MQTYMPNLGAVLMAAVIAAWVGLWVTPAFAAKAEVAQTGQTTLFADGDDGDIQAGVPLPTPRFKDNKNGTVTDKLTGLIWLKNANCFSSRPWALAVETATTLASGQCGLMDGSSAGDWRLPNVKELQSLIDFGFFGPALSNTAGTAQWTDGNPFSGVRSTEYWSSTTYVNGPDHAWSVDLGDGNARGSDHPKVDSGPVWPVRGGQ
jgi:hypothetical protein